MAKKPTENEVLTPAQKAKRTREAKAAKAEADRKQAQMDDALAELRRSPIPEPRYIFKKDEVVQPRDANWIQIKVLEVLDGGKILLSEIESEQNRYGVKSIEKSIRYLSHLELLPGDITLSTKVLNMRAQRPRDVQYSNQMLDSLLHMHYRAKIEYQPEYQRGRVWTDEDKVALIDSVFSRIGIGSFVFVELPFSRAHAPLYEILDGKQRLLTLVEFYEDKFRYQGLTFSELSLADKREFTNYDVSVGRLGERTTLIEKYDYFLRLNTMGKPQSPEHLQWVRDRLAELKAGK